MKELIEHIRLIHFTLLLLCATLLYAVAIGWHGTTVVRIETAAFANFVNEAARSNPSIHRLNPKWSEDRQEELVRNFATITAGHVGAENPDFRGAFKVLRHDSVRIGGTMDQLRGDLEDYRLELLLARSIVQTPQLPAMIREVRGYDGCRIESATFLWDQRTSNSVPADMRFRCVVYGSEAPVAHVSGPYRVLYGYTAATISIDPPWENRFPTVMAFWDDLQYQTLAQAVGWSEQLSQQELGRIGNEFSILGVKINSRHVGILGPIAILVIMVYLAIFVRVLAQVRHEDEPAALWIGLIPGIAARLVFFITIVPLPALAAGFSLFVFVLPRLSMLASGVIVGALGLHVYRITDRQIQQWVEKSTKIIDTGP